MIRRTRHLEPGSVTIRHGFPVFKGERSFLNAAVSVPRRTESLVIATVQQGLTTPDRRRGCLLGLGPIRQRSRILRSLDDLEGGTRSQLEGMFLRTLRRARVEVPIRNYEIRVRGRRVFLDGAYPDVKLFCEVDGRAFHLMTEDWEDDLLRQNDLVVAGWNPVRFSARHIRTDPEGVAATVAAALAARR